MITIHHLENSQSFKILWLLEELGLDYEYLFYPRDAGMLAAPDSYKALSPLGTAPVITDGDLVLAESNAIIDYIIDRYAHGRLKPATTDEAYVRYVFWFHASQGSVQPLLMMKFVLNLVILRAPFFIRPILAKTFQMINRLMLKPRLAKLLDLMEAQLDSSDWLAGDRISAADIAMVHCMEELRPWCALDDRYPNAAAYLERIRQTPSFRRALQKDPGYRGAPRVRVVLEP